MAMMQAAVCRTFGGPEVVRIEARPKPVPRPDEVLVKIHAATVSIADHRLRSRRLPKGLWLLAVPVIGIFRPRKPILGMDCAGTVEAVGAAVTRFRPGDRVFALPGAKFACHAEYRCIAESGAIARLPDSLDFTDAAALPFCGLTALAFFDRTQIEPGTKVLVNGASGAVGSAAVQIAKARGATVTGVTSATNAELVCGLGADRVIDYAQEDFAAGGESYDVVVECVGNAPFERVERIIAPGGALLLVIADLKGLLGARGNSRRSGKLVAAGDWEPTAEGLQTLLGLVESGALRPVVEKVFPFAEIVAAHRHVDSGRKKGNVVLRMVDG